MNFVGYLRCLLLFWGIAMALFGYMGLAEIVVLSISANFLMFKSPPKKPDYKLIDRLERELGLGPPYLAEFPEIQKPKEIEREW